MEDPDYIPEGTMSINTNAYESRSITPDTIGPSFLLQFDQYFENISGNSEDQKDDEVNIESLLDLGKQENSSYNDLYALAKTDFEARMKEAEKTITEETEAIEKSKKEFLNRINLEALKDKEEYLRLLEIVATERNKVTDYSKELERAETLVQKLRQQNYLEEFQQKLPEKSIFTENYRHIYSGAIRYGPTVIRYGLCSEEFNHLCDVVTLNVLHPVEFYALFNAVNYLKNMPPANKDLRPEADDENPVRMLREEQYKANVALCDIFGRTGNDGIIRRDGDNLEVHTVVLWKITDDKIVLIDPTNADFSKIVARHSQIFEGIDIVTAVERFELEDPKFYNKGNDQIKAGRESKDPRDCIDIAVKIGFEIMELQRLSIDSYEIISEVYKEMANYDKTDAANSLKLLRDAHSSDVKKRQHFSYMYHTLNLIREQPINPIILKDFFHPKFDPDQNKGKKGRAKK